MHQTDCSWRQGFLCCRDPTLHAIISERFSDKRSDVVIAYLPDKP
jgi:hypothetical protein